MKVKLLIFVLLVCGAASPVAFAQKTKAELLGVRLGMKETEARARLDKIGRWEEGKELRRDSVWELKGDQRFSHVAIGYDKATRRVRYVTAFARTDGQRVSPADVIDLKSAKRVIDPAGNYRLTQEVRAGKKHPGYIITVFGRDPKFLTRLSVKMFDGAGAEDAADK